MANYKQGNTRQNQRSRGSSKEPARRPKRRQLEQSLRSMEEKAHLLENEPKSDVTAHSLWEEVKGIAKDIYAGAKYVAKDLGVDSLKDLTGLLALL